MPRVSDRAGSLVGLALTSDGILPSVVTEDVGTPEHVYFAAQCLAYGFPCQRFGPALTGDTA